MQGHAQSFYYNFKMVKNNLRNSEQTVSPPAEVAPNCVHMRGRANGSHVLLKLPHIQTTHLLLRLIHIVE